MSIYPPLKSLFSKIADLIPNNIKLSSYSSQHRKNLNLLSCAEAGVLRTHPIPDTIEGAFFTEPRFEPDSDAGKIIIEGARLNAQLSGAELVYQYAKRGEVYHLELGKTTGTFDVANTGSAVIDRARAARDAVTEMLEQFHEKNPETNANPETEELDV